MRLIISAVSLLSLLLTASFQEEKKVKQLPPITHTGENIFACKVDGQLMIASENSSQVIGEFGIKFSHAKANGLMYIQGSCTSPQYDIELSFQYADTIGTYPLVVNYPFYTYFWDYSNSATPNASNQYAPDATHTGSINVTYYDGNIIAGTFSFDAVNRKGQVVHITEGRFDIAKQQ
jgi:hypothetical protein